MFFDRSDIKLILDLDEIAVYQFEPQYDATEKIYNLTIILKSGAKVTVMINPDEYKNLMTYLKINRE